MFKRQRQEVEGDVTVDSIEGDCPSLTIVAGAFTVTTDDTTEFRPSCEAVLPGSRVQIKAFRQPDGSFLASRIMRKRGGEGTGAQNGNGDEEGRR
jgi:hypothetical protein